MDSQTTLSPYLKKWHPFLTDVTTKELFIEPVIVIRKDSAGYGFTYERSTLPEKYKEGIDFIRNKKIEEILQILHETKNSSEEEAKIKMEEILQDSISDELFTKTYVYPLGQTISQESLLNLIGAEVDAQKKHGRFNPRKGITEVMNPHVGAQIRNALADIVPNATFNNLLAFINNQPQAFLLPPVLNASAKPIIYSAEKTLSAKIKKIEMSTQQSNEPLYQDYPQEEENTNLRLFETCVRAIKNRAPKDIQGFFQLNYIEDYESSRYPDSKLPQKIPHREALISLRKYINENLNHVENDSVNFADVLLGLIDRMQAIIQTDQSSSRVLGLFKKHDEVASGMRLALRVIRANHELDMILNSDTRHRL
ncbi:MAG: hypothetical protein H0W64_04440 [Gammaproteobacteria bacterium]|nr:hypothetical protein [Gammaproteobacteria bacterium]